MEDASIFYLPPELTPVGTRKNYAHRNQDDLLFSEKSTTLNIGGFEDASSSFNGAISSTVTSSTSGTGNGAKDGAGCSEGHGAGYGDKSVTISEKNNSIDANGVFRSQNQDEDGFTRLSNALYLKDMDHDGYLLCETAREVVESYSGVYNLGIEIKRLEDVLSQTSNGQHVDIQTLLRMLSQRKT